MSLVLTGQLTFGRLDDVYEGTSIAPSMQSDRSFYVYLSVTVYSMVQ